MKVKLSTQTKIDIITFSGIWTSILRRHFFQRSVQDVPESISGQRRPGLESTAHRVQRSQTYQVAL
jgi:hypothetical protein